VLVINGILFIFPVIFALCSGQGVREVCGWVFWLGFVGDDRCGDVRELNQRLSPSVVNTSSGKTLSIEMQWKFGS
jgi:hypothetical protein